MYICLGVLNNVLPFCHYMLLCFWEVMYAKNVRFPSGIFLSNAKHLNQRNLTLADTLWSRLKCYSHISFCFPSQCHRWPPVFFPLHWPVSYIRIIKIDKHWLIMFSFYFTRQPSESRTCKRLNYLQILYLQVFKKTTKTVKNEDKLWHNYSIF